MIQNKQISFQFIHPQTPKVQQPKQPLNVLKINETPLLTIDKKKFSLDINDFVQQKQKQKIQKTKSQHLHAFNKHTKSQQYQQLNKKVLILYTSGSIASDHNMNVQKNFIRNNLKNNSFICDYNKTVELEQSLNDQQILVSPVQPSNITITYKIMEFTQITSSINANIAYMKSIAKVIKQFYADYDAFIVICGFDAICYVASALSFMFQNLGKLVIFTGGYMSLAQMRNDSIQNLIQCFAIISETNTLNEVIIINKNRGYRGNRSVKFRQGDLISILSPNIAPLIQLNIKITQNQHLFLPKPKAQFQIFTDISDAIKTIRYHPFMKKQILQYQLANPYVKGIVIQSYGSANLPEDLQILEIFKHHHEIKGKVFINISQTLYTTYHSLMSAHLSQFGICYGGDMTVQSALAKLSYLLGKGHNNAEIYQLMKVSLRGQLTEDKNKQQFQLQTLGFLQVINEILSNYFPTEAQQKFEIQIIKNLCSQLTADINVKQLQNIFKRFHEVNPDSTQNLNLKFLQNIINQNNVLHNAVKSKNCQLIKFCLKLSIDFNKLDEQQCSPCYYALQMEQKGLIRMLTSQGGRIICPIQSLMELLIKKLKNDDEKFYELLYHLEFKNNLEDIQNYQKRNVGHLAVLLQAVNCVAMLKKRFKFVFTSKDRYGMTAIQYSARSQNRNIIKNLK